MEGKAISVVIYKLRGNQNVGALSIFHSRTFSDLRLFLEDIRIHGIVDYDGHVLDFVNLQIKACKNGPEYDIYVK